MEKIEGEARLRGGVEEGEKNVSGKGRKTEVLEKCGERDFFVSIIFSLCIVRRCHAFFRSTTMGPDFR